MSENVQIVTEKHITDRGDIRETHYQKGKFLGKGGFAKVYELKREDSPTARAGKQVEKASI